MSSLAPVPFAVWRSPSSQGSSTAKGASEQPQPALFLQYFPRCGRLAVPKREKTQSVREGESMPAVGNTPLIEIEGIFAKLECTNPCGSLKDRIAGSITEGAEN